MTTEQFFKIIKIEKEKKAHGDAFNVFSAMRMEADEVYTHSALISTLLKPKGSHGAGDLYLKLFLQSIPELRELDFDTEKAKVDIEYTIGPIAKDKTQGGRIDILVRSNNMAIIIENKIYAEDQEKQLYRYQQFAESQGFSKYFILYLTLNGKDASKESLFEMREENYIRISYQSTIKDWLSDCINKSTSKPLVHGILVQYQNLILKLTNQDMGTTKKAIIDLCNDADNVETLLWIHNNKNFDSLINDILQNVLLPKLNLLAKKHNLSLSVKGEGKDWLNTNFMSFSFVKPEWRMFSLTFMFQSKRLSEMRCGFRFTEKKEEYSEDEMKLYNQVADMYDGKHTKRWPVCLTCEGYSNWLNKNIISSMYNDNLIGMIEKDLLNLLQTEKHLSL